MAKNTEQASKVGIQKNINIPKRKEPYGIWGFLFHFD